MDALSHEIILPYGLEFFHSVWHGICSMMRFIWVDMAYMMDDVIYSVLEYKI